jgi:hypothetical protein
MSPTNQYFQQIIKFKDIVYHIFWNKKEDYFTIESDNDIVVIYNHVINDLISELQTLKSLIEDNEDVEKDSPKPKR